MKLSFKMKKMILISGPSGSGKSFILQEILSIFPEVRLVNRYTTRPSRDCKFKGEDVIANQTKAQIQECDVIEEFADVFYGFKTEEINKLLNENKIPVILSGNSTYKLKSLFPFAYSISIRPNPKIISRMLIQQGRELTEENKKKYEYKEFNQYVQAHHGEYDLITMNNYDEKSKNDILQGIGSYLSYYKCQH